MINVDRVRNIEAHLDNAVWMTRPHFIHHLRERRLDPFSGRTFDADPAAKAPSREIHQVVDQPLHALDALAHQPKHADRLRIVVCLGENVHTARQTREGIAEVVTEDRDELLSQFSILNSQGSQRVSIRDPAFQMFIDLFELGCECCRIYVWFEQHVSVNKEAAPVRTAISAILP